MTMTTRGRGEADDYVSNFLVAKVEEVQVAADLCKVGWVRVRAKGVGFEDDDGPDAISASCGGHEQVSRERLSQSGSSEVQVAGVIGNRAKSALARGLLWCIGSGKKEVALDHMGTRREKASRIATRGEARDGMRSKKVIMVAEAKLGLGSSGERLCSWEKRDSNNALRISGDGEELGAQFFLLGTRFRRISERETRNRVSQRGVTTLKAVPATKEARVHFLDAKPHVKGIINNIVFMPWDNVCFVTGGSDHAVMLWTEKEENSWKSKALHRSLHSSAVMGVGGMHHKQIVLSAGADKRIIGFDLSTERVDYRHQIDSKCMSILPNPCDFNLFMVQTGTPERQLRLFDIRLRQTEIHAFGWKQESSESQSALINQAWSPDGLYITSGSADPVIHIFDIRYNAHKPSQSVKAHQKRVFKAVWHHSFPLLISISSDLNVGLHKIL
ncbi:transducin family protein [Actinidia rufa]|uniref:Transducin family protein n=1 Tax=Actinidia rufa TaxID=165716 RepID=A0A7J0H2T5_9ERIC|nr:transducin family protein [Actinidia rufa]